MAIFNSIRSAFRFLAIFRLLGSVVEVQRFPSRPGFPESSRYQFPPGSYLISSVVFSCTGFVEVGLSKPPIAGDVIDEGYIDDFHIDYFDLDELRLGARVQSSPRTLS